ncbi:MAG: ATP-binding protein [Acidobacteriota bacterium]
MAADVTSIALRNHLSELERLAGALEKFGARHALGPRLVNQINLVLEEVITNIISYGFPDAGEHLIHIDLRVASDHLTTQVEDDGVPFDITKAPVPDVNVPLEQRPVGGLGVLLVKTLMDEVTYSRRDGRNVLLMTKHTRPIQIEPKHA